MDTDLFDELVTNIGWAFVNTQADSGNGKCLDCPFSRGAEGSGHECQAEKPMDCWVLRMNLNQENDNE